jgi:hypothetical protein
MEDAVRSRIDAATSIAENGLMPYAKTAPLQVLGRSEMSGKIATERVARGLSHTGDRLLDRTMLP